MAAPQASSRLEMLQARFQQKQLQEKEQKLLQLYDQQQQRAYQVAQRSSAGSNQSNNSSPGQHTLTKATTTTHTSSTSQGGKVRQMFDERRQTTVKGIDRSYPLEPLDNKIRKQISNGVVPCKSNVSRQTVTVKRVARSDLNSNTNAGKPVISYHEEVTKDSYGPEGHKHEAYEHDYDGENHVTRYANGNPQDGSLNEYDETLKHRIRNDLESEQFPRDLMIEVPDKLSKRPVAPGRKLTQAETRFERFKNSTAKNPALKISNGSNLNPTKRRTEAATTMKSNTSDLRKPTTSIAAKTTFSFDMKSPKTRSQDYSKLSTIRDITDRGHGPRSSASQKFSIDYRGKSSRTSSLERESSKTLAPEFAKLRRIKDQIRNIGTKIATARNRSSSPRVFRDPVENVTSPGRSPRSRSLEHSRTSVLKDIESRDKLKKSSSPKLCGTTTRIDRKDLVRRGSRERSLEGSSNRITSPENSRLSKISDIKTRGILSKDSSSRSRSSSPRNLFRKGLEGLKRITSPRSRSLECSRTSVLKDIESRDKLKKTSSPKQCSATMRIDHKNLIRRGSREASFEGSSKRTSSPEHTKLSKISDIRARGVPSKGSFSRSRSSSPRHLFRRRLEGSDLFGRSQSLDRTKLEERTKRLDSTRPSPLFSRKEFEKSISIASKQPRGQLISDLSKKTTESFQRKIRDVGFDSDNSFWRRPVSLERDVRVNKGLVPSLNQDVEVFSTYTVKYRAGSPRSLRTSDVTGEQKSFDRYELERPVTLEGDTSVNKGRTPLLSQDVEVFDPRGLRKRSTSPTGSRSRSKSPAGSRSRSKSPQVFKRECSKHSALPKLDQRQPSKLARDIIRKHRSSDSKLITPNPSPILRRGSSDQSRRSTISRSSSLSDLKDDRSREIDRRVAKSPSPDLELKKTFESNYRTILRRSVPASPSKSPDILPRRAVTDIRTQERFLRRPGPGSCGDAGANKLSPYDVRGLDELDAIAFQNGGVKSDINLDDRPEVKDKSSNKKQNSDRQTKSSTTGRSPPTNSKVPSVKTMWGGAKRKVAPPGPRPKPPPIKTPTGALDNLVACSSCNRRFAPDRIGLHEDICIKTKQTKRKQFDSTTIRTRGTELEKYVKRKPNKKSSEPPKGVGKKVDWRKKHHDLINAIRSAKQVQDHLARGGKLTDLPPPPPSDTSDYIQCPHCKRKFNQGAAERHIPICQERSSKATHSQAAQKRNR